MFLADLRRPRSEPSNYYSTEGPRDLPLAKKHKPNPELFQARPDKATSVPLSLEQQQLHKLSSSPKSLSSEGLSSDKGVSSGGSAGTPRWSSREGFSGLGRKAPGVGGGSSLGKEKLMTRLRQREQLGMLVMADRDMADAELLSYRDDLENQDCLTQMDDLQVRKQTLVVSPPLKPSYSYVLQISCKWGNPHSALFCPMIIDVKPHQTDFSLCRKQCTVRKVKLVDVDNSK